MSPIPAVSWKSANPGLREPGETTKTHVFSIEMDNGNAYELECKVYRCNPRSASHSYVDPQNRPCCRE